MATIELGIDDCYVWSESQDTNTSNGKSHRHLLIVDLSLLVLLLHELLVRFDGHLSLFLLLATCLLLFLPDEMSLLATLPEQLWEQLSLEPCLVGERLLVSDDGPLILFLLLWDG